MLYDRAGMKRIARESMRMSRAKPMVVTLVYFAIIFGVSLVINMVSMDFGVFEALFRGEMAHYDTSFVEPWRVLLSLFLSILFTLFGWVLQFGYGRYCLQVARREDAQLRVLGSAFADTGRVLRMNLIITGFMVLWSLAIVGGYLLVVGLLVLVATHATAWLVGMLAVVGYLAVIVLLVGIGVRYVFAPFLMMDHPEWGALDAVRRSREMLRGRTKEMLLLYLSYLGWYLLVAVIIYAVVFVGAVILVFYAALAGSMAMLSVGGLVLVGLSLLAAAPLLLWLTPYMNVTVAYYYCAMSDRSKPSQPVGGEPVEAPSLLPDAGAGSRSPDSRRNPDQPF